MLIIDKRKYHLQRQTINYSSQTRQLIKWLESLFLATLFTHLWNQISNEQYALASSQSWFASK